MLIGRFKKKFNLFQKETPSSPLASQLYEITCFYVYARTFSAPNISIDNKMTQRHIEVVQATRALGYH